VEIDAYELKLEDCQYFQKALHYIWAYGLKTPSGGTRTIHGFDISSILKKTDDGWDWQDFGRWKHDIRAQEILAHQISEKLNANEAKTVRAVARREKKLERLGMKYYAALLSLARGRGVWYVRNCLTREDIENEIRRGDDARRPETVR